MRFSFRHAYLTQSSYRIHLGAVIHITGLNGLGSSSGSQIRSLGSLAGYLDGSLGFACGTTAPAAGGTACWYYSIGTISMTVVEGSALVPGTEIGVSMQIVNDRDSDQSSQTVDIKVEFTPGQFSPAERVVKVQGRTRGVSDGREILRIVVPNFLTKLMTQTSWVPSRQNKITIFLQTNIELEYHDEITISGFNPTATAGGLLQLTEPSVDNAYLFGNQVAYDDSGPGRLLLTIRTPNVKFPSNTLIELGFYVANLNRGTRGMPPAPWCLSCAEGRDARSRLPRGPTEEPNAKRQKRRIAIACWLSHCAT